MTKRPARRRRLPERPFDWESANLKTRVKHLLALAGPNEDARTMALDYYRNPGAYKDPREDMAYFQSEKYVQYKRYEAQIGQRLEKLARMLRAAEKGKTPQSPHDAHAPLNSPTPAGAPPAPAPSAGNCGEEPPRPRALYL